MPNESDFAKELAESIAGQVPIKDIYQDGLKPATKEAGGFLSDLIKTVRLALAPIQYGAVLQDRFRRFIEDSAQRVPDERRVAPVPQILGPVLEGIRYENEGSINDAAFSELLTRAFDRERVGQAHPAFPGIIRTLSEDEMKLLKVLRGQKVPVPCSLQRGEEWKEPSEETLEKELAFLDFPSLSLVYSEHIESLGLVFDLIAISTEKSIMDADGFIPLYWELTLSSFGRLFTSAIMPD